MKWALAAMMLVLLLVPAAAAAREPYASPMQLDLERGHWAEGGFFVGKNLGVRFAAARLDGRIGLFDFAALRVSTSGVDDQDERWMGRAWLGAELYTGWHSDDDSLRLRVGASFEAGTAPTGIESSPPVRVSVEEPAGTDPALRARAGVSLGGNSGHLQLEVADVLPVDQADRYDRAPELRLVALSGAFALDAQRWVWFNSVLTDEVDFGLEAGIWQVLWGSTMGPRTSMGLYVSGNEDYGLLGVSLLHQR